MHLNSLIFSDMYVLFCLLKLSIFLITAFFFENADLLETKLLIGMHVSGEAEVQQSICF